MKKYKAIFFILVISLFYYFPQNVFASGVFNWADQFSGINYQEGKSVAVDSFGNVYTTGFFYGTVDFDPSSNVFELTSFGTSDIFVSKLDTNGNFIWAKHLGGQDYDQGNSIAVDSLGNVYISGYFSGMADFDPNINFYGAQSVGNSDIFINKLDTNGNFIWVKQIGGIFDDEGTFIKVNSNRDVYVTGYFRGIVDFEIGEESYTLSSFGGRDIFVSKVDSLGSFVWIKQMGGIDEDRGYSISIDSNNDILITGSFSGVSDFDPNMEEFNLNSKGGMDIFISKLDMSGNFIWAKQIGGTGEDQCYSVVTDSFGNIYTTGYFGGVSDFDPSSNIYNLTSFGPADIFVSKLNSIGDFVWAKNMGGNADDYGNLIAVDLDGGIYITGSFKNISDFDPSTNIFNLMSNGMSDIFINKLDTNGNFIFAKQIGGTSFDDSNSIFVDSNKNIYTTGYFRNTVDFNPDQGVYLLISKGNTDIFVNKFLPEDIISPEIKMLGDSSVKIYVGEKYIDMGATAYDDVDGDLTAKIITVNKVNNMISGIYQVSYNVFDSSSNIAKEKIRTVNVIPKKPRPKIEVKI